MNWDEKAADAAIEHAKPRLPRRREVGAMITAVEVLDAVRAKYPQAAIVPELTISDLDWLELSEPGCRVAPERRIDALMFQSFQRTAIEVKVSKADFKRDDWHKRRPWARVVHRYIYVVPASLDVMSPHGCGLWAVDERGRIEVRKKAIVQRHPEHLPQEVIQRLAYRAAGASGIRRERS